MSEHHPSRRQFLAQTSLLAAGSMLPLASCSLLTDAGMPKGQAVGYGALKPVKDLTTGLPLIELPAGFTYRSFGWTGSLMSDGVPTPSKHDGMGVVKQDADHIWLVRNHEVTKHDGAFGAAHLQYDPMCSGGTTTLKVSAKTGELISSHASLAGTLINCAGGVTPWGTWLSCEEIVTNPDPSRPDLPQKPHGFLFDVPPEGVRNPQPLTDMGQFRHEAAAVDAQSGDVYMTEDMDPISGFFKFVPNTPGKLIEGGKLYMMRVKGREDTRKDMPVNQPFACDWVLIDEPTRGMDADGGILGVQQQGLAKGASKFTRLEGCYGDGTHVWFTATNGGNAETGQVFRYLMKEQTLTLVYESPSIEVLEYPDNIAMSPRGGLLMCQDGKHGAQCLFGLTRDAELFTFARNHVHLDDVHGFSGDFTSSEWAGAAFSLDGKWLFVNLQTPGITLAITGPWKDGLV